MSNKKIVIIFLLLIGVQMLFSFVFPAYDSTSYWPTVQELTGSVWNRQRYSLDSFDNSLKGVVGPILDNYHVNLDVGGYLLIAHDFPQHYFKGNYTLLTRPLYPILVSALAKPLHFISKSYSTTFFAGLLTNVILFFLAVYLFYWLVKKYVSQRTAILSSVLLIFSPFAHVWLIQPETNIFTIFAIVFSLFLIDNYLRAPNLRKLVIFSLAVGFLLLGKKLFALTIFVLLLALLYRRFKEGIIFFVVHLVPLAFWAFWITKVWGLPLYVSEVSEWNYGVWVFNIFSWPWDKTFQIFLNFIPNFISMVVYGFLLLPVVLALIGYKRLAWGKKNIFILSFVFSFFVLVFGMQLFIPRFGFWLFPVILPLAVLGIDTLADFTKKHNKSYGLAVCVSIYALIIFISSLNIYRFSIYG